MAAQKVTKTQLIALVHEALGDESVSKASIDRTLEALTTVAHEQLKKGFVVEVPGLVRIKTQDKAATPERQKKNPFTGQMMTVAAKPASKKVKALPVKALKDIVADK